MDTRLALLSAAAFAGVVFGGALVADPALGSSVSPASVWSQATGVFGGKDSDEREEHDDNGDEGELHENGEHGMDEHEQGEARDGTKHPALSIPVGERRAPGEVHHGQNEGGEHEEDGHHDDREEDDD